MADISDIKDGCPDWAAQLIHQLVALEIKLGNLAKENAWSNEQMESLMNKAFDDLSENSRVEEEVESLFHKISKGLSEAGFSAGDIAGFVNARATSNATKLPYCSADEVIAAI